jgi:L-lactate dehydrogenase complex protein LldG
MDAGGQKEFLDRMRKALGHSPDDWQRKANLFDPVMSDEDRALLQGIRDRTAEQRKTLLATLIENAKPLNLNVVPLGDESAVTGAIFELVQQKEPEWGEKKSVVCWQHSMIARLNLADDLKNLDVPVYFAEGGDAAGQNDVPLESRNRFRQQVIDAYIGLTSADFCMADTAALVLRTRPGQARSVSLVPSIHIAVINIDQILADLKELVALLKWEDRYQTEGLTNCMTFISGPSKTADIEATMVHGAHGPREVYIFVITGPGMAASLAGSDV